MDRVGGESGLSGLVVPATGTASSLRSRAPPVPPVLCRPLPLSTALGGVRVGGEVFVYVRGTLRLRRTTVRQNREKRKRRRRKREGGEIGGELQVRTAMKGNVCRVFVLCLSYTHTHFVFSSFLNFLSSLASPWLLVGCPSKTRLPPRVSAIVCLFLSLSGLCASLSVCWRLCVSGIAAFAVHVPLSGSLVFSKKENETM